MFRSIFSFTALMLIILMGNINAATYYVDNAIGNDGNTGLSTSTPWKTFAKVCNTSLASGSIVSFKCDQRFLATTSFNQSNITINSYGTGAKPVIDGNRSVVIMELGGTNVTVNGLKFVNGHPCNISINGSYITLESCNVDSNYYINAGTNDNPNNIYATGNHITIRNSTLSYANLTSSASYGNGIYVDGADYCLFEYDTLSFNSHDGFRIAGDNGYSTGSQNNTIRYCVMKGNGYAGIEATGLQYSNVYYNLIETSTDPTRDHSGGSGIFFNDQGAGFAPHDDNFYNNTIINHNAGWDNFALWIQPISAMVNITFKNNIFYCPEGGQYTQYWQQSGDGVTASSWVFTNNCYYMTGDNSHLFVKWDVGSFSTLSDWQSATGYETNSIMKDPMFTNNAEGNYILQSGSPAINSGAYVSLTTDINGNPVPSNYPDMGAYQHSTGGGGGGGIVPALTLNLTALIEALYTAGGTAMSISPWVTVELHNSTTPYALVDSNSAALDPTGAGTFTFTKAVSGTDYYIVLKSMNTIATWSASPHSFISSALSYNFTTAVTQAYTDGSNPPLALHNGKYCIYSGDVNKDGFVNKTDFTLIDKDNSTFNYHPVNDLNGDGLISSADEQFIDNNYIIAIHRQVPAGAQ